MRFEAKLRLQAALLTLALIGATNAEDMPAPIPPAVINDPAPDPVHPPHSAQVLVPSHGMGMNALFYLAGGVGPARTLCCCTASRGTSKTSIWRRPSAVPGGMS
jgi:hypothetical protein